MPVPHRAPGIEPDGFGAGAGGLGDRRARGPPGVRKKQPLGRWGPGRLYLMWCFEVLLWTESGGQHEPFSHRLPQRVFDRYFGTTFIFQHRPQKKKNCDKRILRSAWC